VCADLVHPLGAQTGFPFPLKPVLYEHHLEPGCMNIVYSQDGSTLTNSVCTCVPAGWKGIAPSTDGCRGSNHSTAETLLMLWAGALQAKENPSENKQPPG